MKVVVVVYNNDVPAVAFVVDIAVAVVAFAVVDNDIIFVSFVLHVKSWLKRYVLQIVECWMYDDTFFVVYLLPPLQYLHLYLVYLYLHVQVHSRSNSIMICVSSGTSICTCICTCIM